jgi:PEP-CTERM motif
MRKLVLFSLAFGVVAVMFSGRSIAIPINERELFHQLVSGLTNIQVGTLFLCESQNITLGVGSCSDRNAVSSDEIVFSQIGPNILSVIMQSDTDPGDRDPPAADLIVPPIPFLLPFVSMGEPNGNKEGLIQTYNYLPDLGQPGYALLNNSELTWQIISDDVPEPSTFLLLCSGLFGAFVFVKKGRDRLR